MVPIYVKQWKETNSISADMTEDIPLKIIRTTLVTTLFRHFGSCFVHLTSAGF
jgi:hypothetical protein